MTELVDGRSAVAVGDGHAGGGLEHPLGVQQRYAVDVRLDPEAQRALILGCLCGVIRADLEPVAAPATGPARSSNIADTTASIATAPIFHVR